MRVALAGIGKIAVDQHLPTINERKDVHLTATVSRSGRIDGIPAFTTLSEALEHHPEIDSVVLCTPPQVRYDQAREALLAGRHVFLEKPPAATLSEVGQLADLAAARGLTLFASWHSRCAPAVEPARRWLKGREVQSVEIQWRESVRKWHPGQDWIFEPGGMGVFDPGINALSLVTRILPEPFFLTQALLEVPANRQAPIAAQLNFKSSAGYPLLANFDFRAADSETWQVCVATSSGDLLMQSGGAELQIDGDVVSLQPAEEYAGLYERFVRLVANRESDVDLSPLIHVADAFLLGHRKIVAEFHWD